MMTRSSYLGRVEALCGFTATAHGSASVRRMDWNLGSTKAIAPKLWPGVEEVPA